MLIINNLNYSNCSTLFKSKYYSEYLQLFLSTFSYHFFLAKVGDQGSNT